MARVLRIATVNVNGIRAALRRGMGPWLDAVEADVVTLQEVRAPDALVHELMADSGYHVVHTEAAAKGRAGVAVLSRTEPKAHRVGHGDPSFDDAGRWIESDVVLDDGSLLTVVSAYVHSGGVGTPSQDDKYRFLDQLLVRLGELREHADHAVVTGDFNVGHTERDIKNWRGNLKKAGFLPEERAYLDRVRDDLGWVDVARAHAGDVDGPYTWWSWRGQAFDNDTGWRIDYQLATPELAAAAVAARVDRAPTYAERFSDHAPLVVDYDV